MTVTATASDGAVEAIEVTEARFAVGVQWHPEILGPGHRDIYRALVAAAGGAA